MHDLRAHGPAEHDVAAQNKIDVFRMRRSTKEIEAVRFSRGEKLA